MKKPVEIAGTALLAILLLVLADRWLQPVPIPAATAVAGGLVALWLGRRVELVGASVGGGALLGVAVHVYAHRTGNSTFPPEGLPVHAVIDGVRGLAVAVVVILGVLALGVLVGRLRGRSAVLCLLVPLLACGPPQDSEPPSDATESPGEAAAPESPKFIQEVTWAPDGSRLAFSRLDVNAEEYRIFSIGVDGSGLTQLTSGPWDVWTSWSPDGSRIAFGSKRDDNNDVYVMNADGTDPIRLTDDPAPDGEPAWSPDGSTIAFTSERDDERRIFLMNSDGSNQRRVGAGPGSEYAPRWSPDGSRLTFYATVAPGDDRIYVMNADGTDRREVAEGYWPSWSPDGSRILFPAHADAGLVVARSDGNEPTVIVAGDVVLGEWAPDGTKIAFIKVTWRAPEYWPSTSEIFIANADGSGEVQLTGD
jgi:Tol biopolymer transport system component